MTSHHQAGFSTGSVSYGDLLLFNKNFINSSFWLFFLTGFNRSKHSGHRHSLQIGWISICAYSAVKYHRPYVPNRVASLFAVCCDFGNLRVVPGKIQLHFIMFTCHAFPKSCPTMLHGLFENSEVPLSGTGMFLTLLVGYLPRKHTNDSSSQEKYHNIFI